MDESCKEISNLSESQFQNLTDDAQDIKNVSLRKKSPMMQTLLKKVAVDDDDDFPSTVRETVDVVTETSGVVATDAVIGKKFSSERQRAKDDQYRLRSSSVPDRNSQGGSLQNLSGSGSHKVDMLGSGEGRGRGEGVNGSVKTTRGSHFEMNKMIGLAFQKENNLSKNYDHHDDVNNYTRRDVSCGELDVEWQILTLVNNYLEGGSKVGVTQSQLEIKDNPLEDQFRNLSLQNSTERPRFNQEIGDAEKLRKRKRKKTNNIKKEMKAGDIPGNRGNESIESLLAFINSSDQKTASVKNSEISTVTKTFAKSILPTKNNKVHQVASVDGAREAEDSESLTTGRWGSGDDTRRLTRYQRWNLYSVRDDMMLPELPIARHRNERGSVDFRQKSTGSLPSSDNNLYPEYSNQALNPTPDDNLVGQPDTCDQADLLAVLQMID